MKTIAFTSILAALAMAGQAEAKSSWTEMSMVSFRSQCRAGGGAIAALPGKHVRCTASNGVYITCIDTKGFGITCDWNTVDGRRPPILSENGGTTLAGGGGTGRLPNGGGAGGGGDADNGGEGEGGQSAE